MGSACCAGRDAGTSCADKSSQSVSGRSHHDSSTSRKKQHPRQRSSVIVSPMDKEDRRLEKLAGELTSEQREQIRLAAKSLVLDIPINPREVSEWFSPITCEGAALAANLSEVIRANAKSVTFRAYIKLVVIQEEVISKLLGNLRSSDQSLRYVSVSLLSAIVVPSQYELTRIFINSEGLRKLKTMLCREQNEGLTATIMQLNVSIYITGTEFHAQVYETLPVIAKRVKHMRKAGYLLETLECFAELIRLKPDQPAVSTITGCGLREALQELQRASTDGEILGDTVPQVASLRQTIEALEKWAE